MNRSTVLAMHLDITESEAQELLENDKYLVFSAEEAHHFVTQIIFDMFSKSCDKGNTLKSLCYKEIKIGDLYIYQPI